MSATTTTGLIFIAGAYVFGLVYERMAGHRPAGLDGVTLAGGTIGIVVCSLLFG